MNMLQMAAKLHDCKDSVKFLCGDKYDEKIQPFITLIKGVMDHNKIEALPAAIKLAEHYKDNGMATMMIFAAAVDLVDA